MKRLFLSIALIALFTAACEQATTDPPVEAADEIAFKKVKGVPADQSPVPMDMSEWNAKIAAADDRVALAYFEYVTAPESDQVGRTVFASDRGNKQLGSDWVAQDPLRPSGTDIWYLVDDDEGTTASGLSAGQTTAAIDKAMQTWNDIDCSEISIVNLGVSGFDVGFVQFLLGFGGFPGFLEGITHAGWLPAAFFDAVVPGGSEFILGVTFTFVWTGTDLDNNGKEDVAFREIYYNDAFPWAIDGNFDVETVAHHEAGHGLSQAHFGDIFRDAGAGKLHFAPLAVMNAAYSGVQQTPTGTDIGGHCSNWASWPNN